MCGIREFCPELEDGFETRTTGTDFPEIRWHALVVRFSSIRLTSVSSVERIKG